MSGQVIIGTAHAILILTKGVTVAPPVAVIAAVGQQSTRSGAFAMDGSGSYHTDSNKSIIEYLWDWDASNGVDFNTPGGTGARPSNPGYTVPGNYTVTLRVRDNNDPSLTDTATIVVQVIDGDVAPVAVAIPASRLPAYTGRIGETIQLDGTSSYDPDGDVITLYEWDLDGDGQFDDAVGATPTVSFAVVYTGQISLRVTANGKTGVSASPVDIYSSPVDLKVDSITASSVVVGTLATITAVLSNNATSGSGQNNVVVRFFNDNPLTSGSQLGGSYSVNLPVGGSATVVANLTGLGAAENIYVYLDATQVVAEWDELNNIASVGVANQAPTVSCPENATIEVTSTAGAVANLVANFSDPDGDALTVNWFIDDMDNAVATHNLAGGSTSDALEATLSIGEHLVRVQVTDGKSAPVSCEFTVTVEDTTVPSVTAPGPVVVATDVGVCSASGVALGTPTVVDNGEVVSVTNDAPAVFGKGVTVVTWTVRDASGNTATATQTVTVEDRENPTVTVPANIVVGNDAGRCDAVVNFNVSGSDNCGVASVVSIPASGSVFAKGTTTVVTTVTDTSGNVSTSSFTVTVEDRENPTVTVPANIVVGNDAGRCDAVVNFNVSGADNCGVASVVSVPASGSVFAKGTTTVVTTVTDTAGNVSTASFTVTVNDTEAPVATCIPTTNPSGNNIPKAGTNPKSGQNPDGFYQLAGADNCDAPGALKLYVKDSASNFIAGPFAHGAKVKITQAPGVTPNSKPMAGEVVAHIQLKGDALLVVEDGAGNVSVSASCLVAPRPK